MLRKDGRTGLCKIVCADCRAEGPSKCRSAAAAVAWNQLQARLILCDKVEVVE